MAKLRCLHENAVPVESIRDPAEILARLCPDCDAQLPAGLADSEISDRWDTLCAQLTELDGRLHAAARNGHCPAHLRERRLAVWAELKYLASVRD